MKVFPPYNIDFAALCIYIYFQIPVFLALYLYKVFLRNFNMYIYIGKKLKL